MRIFAIAYETADKNLVNSNLVFLFFWFDLPFHIFNVIAGLVLIQWLQVYAFLHGNGEHERMKKNLDGRRFKILLVVINLGILFIFAVNTSIVMIYQANKQKEYSYDLQTVFL